jgi:tetratricopeptide (TPR) repeat protein
MRHTLFILLLTTLLARRAHSQTPTQLQQINLLELSSQFDKTISTVQSLIDSNTLPPADLGRAWLLLGSAYRELGEYTKARQSFEQAARLFEAQNLRDDYASALDHMGILDNIVAQQDAAEREWKKAAKIFEQTGYRAGLARVYLNLAQHALLTNRLKLARKYVDQAAHTALASEEWLPTDVAHFYFTKASVSYREGRFAEAASGYQTALDLSTKIIGESSFMAGSMYAYLGLSLAKQGHTGLALENARKALTIIQATEGRQTMRYFVAETMYAQVLDLSGLHTESEQLKNETARAVRDFYGTHCPACTTSILSFR